MNIWLNDPRTGKRKSEEVEVIKRNKKTIWVKLQDGHIIKRKIARDV